MTFFARPPVTEERCGLVSRRRFLSLLGAGAAAGPLATLLASPAEARTLGTATAIPVLAYHQLDNDPDVESITSAAFAANLDYLKSNGYSSISAADYVAWASGQRVKLPARPILITVDDGILNFFAAGTPILRAHGFSAVAFIVTGFADGAGGGNPDNVGWNATWSQIRALDSRVWETAFHAGAQGHTLQTYDPAIPYFYDARMPGETDAQFERRVTDDITTGRRELASKLAGRPLNQRMWAVPWNDAGQPGQPYDGSPGWLEQYASSTFGVVFLQDPGRNGSLNERFRFEVQGWMTESYFEQTLASYVSSGAFDR